MDYLMEAAVIDEQILGFYLDKDTANSKVNVGGYDSSLMADPTQLIYVEAEADSMFWQNNVTAIRYGSSDLASDGVTVTGY
jgi:hypothetical protein